MSGKQKVLKKWQVLKKYVLANECFIDRVRLYKGCVLTYSMMKKLGEMKYVINVLASGHMEVRIDDQMDSIRETKRQKRMEIEVDTRGEPIECVRRLVEFDDYPRWNVLLAKIFKVLPVSIDSSVSCECVAQCRYVLKVSVRNALYSHELDMLKNQCEVEEIHVCVTQENVLDVAMEIVMCGV